MMMMCLSLRVAQLRRREKQAWLKLPCFVLTKEALVGATTPTLFEQRNPRRLISPFLQFTPSKSKPNLPTSKQHTLPPLPQSI